MSTLSALLRSGAMNEFRDSSRWRPAETGRGRPIAGWFSPLGTPDRKLSSGRGEIADANRPIVVCFRAE